MRTPLRHFAIASLVGHLAVAALTVALPIILTEPARRTGAFWGAVAWTGFLALLRWSVVTGYRALLLPGWRAIPGLGGVLPGLGLLVTACWLLSAAILGAAVLLHPKGVASRLHLAAQMGLGALFVVGGVLFYMARAAAIADMQPFPAGVPTPRELAERLREQERRLGARGRPDLDSLRERLRGLRESLYALSHLGRVADEPHYRQLAAGVMTLCRQAANLIRDGPGPDRLEAAAASARALRTQADLLARRLRNG